MRELNADYGHGKNPSMREHEFEKLVAYEHQPEERLNRKPHWYEAANVWKVVLLYTLLKIDRLCLVVHFLLQVALAEAETGPRYTSSLARDTEEVGTVGEGAISVAVEGRRDPCWARALII